MEMEPDVIRRHIELYVNPYSLQLGRKGRAAVAELFDRARQNGIFSNRQGFYP